jgi:hypothetical protein
VPLDDFYLFCRFEGNPKLCATGPCNSSSGNKETTVIAPVAAAIAIFIAVLVLIIVFIKKRPSSIRGNVNKENMLHYKKTGIKATRSYLAIYFT